MSSASVRRHPAPALVTNDGRSWSWDDLDAEYRTAIESFARSRGIRDAGDVVGDVFAAALPRLGSFSGSTADLRSFLFTIAHRRIADEHRRFYRRPERLTAEPVSGAALDATDDEVIERDDARSAFEALSILDDRSRDVLLLRIVEERSADQVAAELGLSAANVRKIQSRALRLVSRHLENSRHTTAGRAMALVVTPFIRRLRGADTLPTDDTVGEWIAALRAEATAAGATSAADAGALVAAATATGASVTAVSSITTTVAATAATGGTIMKTSLTLSVLAATAAAVGGGVAANAIDGSVGASSDSAAIVSTDDGDLTADAATGGSLDASTDDSEVTTDASAVTSSMIELDGDDTVGDVAVGGAADTALDFDDVIDADATTDLTADARLDLDDEIDVSGDVSGGLDLSLDDDLEVRGGADVTGSASVDLDDDVVGATIATTVDVATAVTDDADAALEATVDTAVELGSDADVDDNDTTVEADAGASTTISIGMDESDENDDLIDLGDDDERIDLGGISIGGLFG